MYYKETFGIETELDGTFNCYYEKFSRKPDEEDFESMLEYSHNFKISLEELRLLFEKHDINEKEALKHLASPKGIYYIEKWY